MNNQYKIEKSRSVYMVSCYQGAYSDRSEQHLAFAANSAEEAWIMFKGFKKTEEDVYYEFREEKFYPEAYVNYKKGMYGDDWEEDGNSWDMATVEIEPLSIIFTFDIK